MNSFSFLWIDLIKQAYQKKFFSNQIIISANQFKLLHKKFFHDDEFEQLS